MAVVLRLTLHEFVDVCHELLLACGIYVYGLKASQALVEVVLYLVKGQSVNAYLVVYACHLGYLLLLVEVLGLHPSCECGTVRHRHEGKR